MSARSSRRRFVQMTLAGLGAPWISAAHAGEEKDLRIGVVLPARTAHALTVASSQALAAAVANQGAELAAEEYGFNASLLERRLDVYFAVAPDAEAARRAAERLIAVDDVFALVGGYQGQAQALQRAAERGNRLFFNIGSTNDALRHETCSPNTFHIEASAAMYLDACATFFVRAGMREWFLVVPDDDDGHRARDRARSAIGQRHWGARIVGDTAVDPLRADFTQALDEIRAAGPDLVLMLLPWLGQLDFLAQYDAARLDAAVTAMPDPVAQTREFFATARERAPRAGAGRRLVLWEPTLDAYGARELNHRFLERWGAPMDAPGWAAYQSIKILFEAAMQAGTRADRLIAHLESPQAVFDVHKGIGVSFRAWDHQLRQSLYLVRVDAGAEQAWDLAALEGELPAIYMPGTDPVERLDQLGDLADQSSCLFAS